MLYELYEKLNNIEFPRIRDKYIKCHSEQDGKVVSTEQGICSCGKQMIYVPKYEELINVLGDNFSKIEKIDGVWCVTTKDGIQANGTHRREALVNLIVKYNSL